MKTIAPSRPALSRMSAIFETTLIRSPGRIGAEYSHSEPPSRPRNSPMPILISGIAAPSERQKVGGAIIPPKRVLRAAASSLNSGSGSPIASAKRRIAPRSTSTTRASLCIPICLRTSSVTYLFAIAEVPVCFLSASASRACLQSIVTHNFGVVPAGPALRLKPHHDPLLHAAHRRRIVRVRAGEPQNIGERCRTVHQLDPAADHHAGEFLVSGTAFDQHGGARITS